jgi:predicted acetyltransferase
VGGIVGRETALSRPDSRYEASLRSFVGEFADAGEELVPWVLAKLAEHGDDFAAYVAWLERESRGEGLAHGRVPHSTFWLVDGSGEIVAVANLRHRLNAFLSEVGGHIGFGVRPSARRQGFATEVLRSTLIEAAKLGIDKAFVTCDKDNVGSERTILKNGGVLQDEVWSDVYSRIVKRFWIGVPNARSARHGA